MAERENKPFFTPFIGPPFETKQVEEKAITPIGAGNMILGLLPGLVLIVLGVLFLLSNYGYLTGEWWQYFLVGLGVVIFIESRLQYHYAQPRWLKTGRLITAILMIGGGLLFLFNPNQWWPLVFIGIGILLCAYYLWRRRQQKHKKVQKELQTINEQKEKGLS